MTVHTAIAIALVVGFGAAQYMLMAQALRDLARRSRVRGGNKVAWGLLILCIPMIGALLYGWMGPTSLMRRSPATPPPEDITSIAPGRVSHDAGKHRNNITPISAARSRRTPVSRDTAAGRFLPRRFPRTGS